MNPKTTSSTSNKKLPGNFKNLYAHIGPRVLTTWDEIYPDELNMTESSRSSINEENRYGSDIDYEDDKYGDDECDDAALQAFEMYRIA